MKFALNRVTVVSLFVGAVLGFATCKVNLGDDLVYTCASDGDCGGGGYKCAINKAGGTCCLPSGKDDTCDGVDNDCDGQIDNTGKTEVCNGLDDDCNGKTDELFDLVNDPNNCGSCKHVCGAMEPCLKGVCTKIKETVCFDKMDNDNNTLTDCDDPNCENRACEELVGGCLCKNMKKAEVVCDDGVDNDQDLLVDCLDPDCIGKFCTPPQLYFQCTPQLTCKCNGSVQIAEVGSVRCRDDIDNDCNGVKDCAELTCGGQSCQNDGGPTCECFMGRKKEKDCSNQVDDDGDTLIDCADFDDCAPGTLCNSVDGGVCSSSKTCGQ